MLLVSFGGEGGGGGRNHMWYLRRFCILRNFLVKELMHFIRLHRMYVDAYFYGFFPKSVQICYGIKKFSIPIKGSTLC